jgi:DNA-binding MltR family transcriptional regulator
MREDLNKQLDEVFLLRGSLSGESDRGCALMAAAFLDGQLEKLLRQTFVASERIADDLLGPSKPIGTFSSRIDLAFMLGFLSEQQRRDLHLIRKIRNDFGHNPSPITFDHPPIANRCRELTYSFHKQEARARGHYTNAVFNILATIDSAILRTKHTEQRLDYEITEEIKQTTKEIARAAIDTALLSGENIEQRPNLEITEEIEQTIREIAQVLLKDFYLNAPSS